MDVSEHIEKYLGRIEYGWSLRDKRIGFQVVKISNVPEWGVVAYSTLGMSQSVLAMPGAREARLELVLAAYERYEPSKVASFLLTFGEYVVSRGRALLRGEVIGPEKPLIPGVRTDSSYSSLPVMFNPGLATFSGSDPHTVFVWLIPILGLEANFVRLNGWNAFEDSLEKDTPDFWDLDRRSLAEVERKVN